MESIEFKQTNADPCVYVRTLGTITIVAVYVNDLILITATAEEMKKVKESLTIRFRMNNMGELHYCLGITIMQDKNEKCLWVHQRQYVQNMLEKYGLTEAKVVSTLASYPGSNYAGEGKRAWYLPLAEAQNH